MAIANINTINAGENGRFVKIATDYKQYANNLKTNFTTQSGGSDHFISMFNDIDTMAGKYNYNDENSLRMVMSDIQNIPNLRSWVSAVFCAMMYGFDENNSLNIQGIPFETANPDTGQVTDIKGKEYLKVWKEKFNTDNGNNTHNTNDSDQTRIVNGNSSPYSDLHSLNVISFGNGTDYPDLIGCFSDKYFIIPLKEFKLNQYRDSINPWKQKYFELFENNDFVKGIQSLNVRQKVLLYLSAGSIGANAPKPLQLIKGIILKYVSVQDYGVAINQENIPSYRKICGIEFYKTSSVIDLDNLVSKKIYIGIDRNANGLVYRATYPITDVLVNGLKNKNSFIDNIQFNVTPKDDDPKAVTEAEFSFDYHDKFLFLAASNVNQVNYPFVSYVYHVIRKYSVSDIINITKLQTMCMYPNIPVEFEDRCEKYTYFSLDQTFILTIPMNGASRVIDLSDGLFIGCINDNNRQLLIKKDKNINNSVYCTKKTPNGSVFTAVSSVPEHFIDVCDMSGNSCGYVLNIRTNNSDVPALMTSNTKNNFKIQLPDYQPAQDREFRAYVDFGSSSSCMKYRIANAQGMLSDTTVFNRCTVRTLLAEYFKNDYKLVINDPETNSYTKFMSISTIYDEQLGAVDYSIYKDGWMPVTPNLNGYEPTIKVLASNKTQLIHGVNNVSPNIIINNLCYTIACNAVTKDCNKVFIVPSLPNSDYKDKLLNIWNYAIKNVRTIFPNLKIYNALNTDNIQYLLESIAVSNGMNNPAVGNLSVSIDMGDGTTDMSAILLDRNGQRIMCGQASVEYAGKNLIKTVVRDILENVNSKKHAENILKGNIDSATSSLFTPSDDSPEGEQEYEGKVNNLINIFFQGDQLVRPKPDDDSWENKIIDILDISNLTSNIDQKVAANLILRYAILMPVIKDFIQTAIKLAGNKFDENTSIKIEFVGGSAKGIALLNVVDSLRNIKAGQILENYFKKAFKNNVTVVGTAGIQNGKDLLIDGLSRLNISPNANNNGCNISLPNAQINQQAEQWKKIDPSEIADLGNSIHKDALNFPFKSMAECENNRIISEAANKTIINNPSSYYKGYPENNNAPFEEFKDYFDNEIYNKLIDDGNGIPDTIETLITGFVRNASPSMKNAIDREITNMVNDNSFYRATHSSVYPEMIKNTIFMFAVSKLLSEFHGGYREDGIITRTANGYQFGG